LKFNSVSLERHIYEFQSRDLFQEICGIHDSNLPLLEQALALQLIPRGISLILRGDSQKGAFGLDFFSNLEKQMQKERTRSDYSPEGTIRNALEARAGLTTTEIKPIAEPSSQPAVSTEVWLPGLWEFSFRQKVVPKSENQRLYLESLQRNIITLAIGPAGTGKTFLAVTYALHALQNQQVRRIMLTRPAVEAGENLGFLPGDLVQKVDPYLRPLYDSLNDLIGFPQVKKYMDEGVIEIAPLAFMRGRTLARSFIILDEAQNVTSAQMKMFLTRIGEGSRVAISGDITQVDLNQQKSSGLKQAMRILHKIPQIGIVRMGREDITRHPIIDRIIQAYESAESDEQNEHKDSPKRGFRKVKDAPAHSNISN